MRISIDHHTSQRHKKLRGTASWAPMIEGLTWLAANGFHTAAAGRRRWDDDASQTRAVYAELLRAHDIRIDADDAARLVLFPEMDATMDVPEITTACWDILAVSPDAMMCATSRMVVKEKGGLPKVMPCTLLPYDSAFSMGQDLASSSGAVSLNHPHCARFCVLGRGSCSAPLMDAPAELELGEIPEAILVFGGPYENLEATKTVLAKAARLRIPLERMNCTGDVAAYCAEPLATANALRGAGVAVLMGNCEEAFGSGAENCGCGFEEGTQ